MYYFFKLTSNLLLDALLPPTNEVWGKVIFLHLSVILFTGGGVPGQVPLWDQVHPHDQVHPLGPGTPSPWDQVPPGTRYPLPLGPGTPPGTRYINPPQTRYIPRELCMLGDTGNMRPVRILLECILVSCSWSHTTTSCHIFLALGCCKSPLILRWDLFIHEITARHRWLKVWNTCHLSHLLLLFCFLVHSKRRGNKNYSTSRLLCRARIFLS